MPGGTSKLVEEKVIMPCLNFESLSLKKYGGYTYVQNIRPVGEAFFLPMIATENRAPNFSLINRILNTVKEAYSTKNIKEICYIFFFFMSFRSLYFHLTFSSLDSQAKTIFYLSKCDYIGRPNEVWPCKKEPLMNSKRGDAFWISLHRR